VKETVLGLRPKTVATAKSGYVMVIFQNGSEVEWRLGKNEKDDSSTLVGENCQHYMRQTVKLETNCLKTTDIV